MGEVGAKNPATQALSLDMTGFRVFYDCSGWDRTSDLLINSELFYRWTTEHLFLLLRYVYNILDGLWEVNELNENNLIFVYEQFRHLNKTLSKDSHVGGYMVSLLE